MILIGIIDHYSVYTMPSFANRDPIRQLHSNRQPADERARVPLPPFDRQLFLDVFVHVVTNQQVSVIFQNQQSTSFIGATHAFISSMVNTFF
jgi:hypothetical protein